MIIEEYSPYKSISDWVSMLTRNAASILSEGNIEISKQTCALLYLAVKGIAPIHAICVHWKGAYYPVSSVEQLNIYYQFVRNDFCIGRTDWSISEKFPSANNTFSFHGLELAEQQSFLKAKVSGCCYYISSKSDLVLLQNALYLNEISKLISNID